MACAPLQVLAVAMAAANAAVWLVWSRWERPGHRLVLRARVPATRLIGRGGDVVQVLPLVYPLLVAVAPGWVQAEWSTWSTTVDPVLKGAGIALWALGIALGLWAARAIGGYGAVGGVTVDHRLVTEGPYQHVRHPIYTALIAIAVGTTLAFRSYLLVAVAVLSIAVHRWWAAAEETLLSSGEGFGEEYRSYATRTGRFLPRMRRR